MDRFRRIYSYSNRGQRDHDFYRLKHSDEGYFVTKRSEFRPDGVISREMLKQTFDFAYAMTFGGIGQHRGTRSGGDHCRQNREIFADAFQGKIAECALCGFLSKYDRNAVPDFSAYKQGVWDTGDLQVCGKEVSVKSTKHIGQLLLLETKDYGSNGEYLPNVQIGTQGVFDCIVLIRLKPICENLLNSGGFRYSEFIEHQALWDIISKETWEYNIVGYITRDDLIYIIKNRYILPKGSMLNGKQRMDAENYYVQAVDMRAMHTFGRVMGLDEI